MIFMRENRGYHGSTKKEDVVEPLIRVQNLMKIYNPGENEVRALDDVSWISDGESLWQSSGSRAPENPPL